MPASILGTINFIFYWVSWQYSILFFIKNKPFYYNLLSEQPNYFVCTQRLGTYPWVRIGKSGIHTHITVRNTYFDV